MLFSTQLLAIALPMPTSLAEEVLPATKVTSQRRNKKSTFEVLRALPEQQRTCYLLFNAGLSYEAIAAKTSMPIAAVTSCIREARVSLIVGHYN